MDTWRRVAGGLALGAVLATGCKKEGGDSSGGPTPPDLDLIVSTERPSKRSEILAGAHPATNSILVFGGNQGPVVNQIPSPSFLKDTWIFEPGYGWTEIDAKGPSKRGRYALSVDHEGQRALLFGGRYRDEGASGDYTLYNDLWEFSFKTRTWTKLDNGNGGPAPRYYANSAWDADEGRLYVWGGLTNASPMTIEVAMDLWSWDGSKWKEHPTGGDAPSQRGFLTAAHDTRRDRMVIFGGQPGDFVTNAYGDTYALSLDSFEWVQLHDGERKPVPDARMHAHFLYDADADRYLMFGGHTNEGDMNDLWSMDPETGKWSKVYIADRFTGVPLGCMGNGAEIPADYVEMDLAAPERRHRGMFAQMWGSLWVFGGLHGDCSDHLDDTWRYDLATDTWHELLSATSGEACLRAGNDCECLCI